MGDFSSQTPCSQFERQPGWLVLTKSVNRLYFLRQVVKLFEAMDQEETTTSQRGDNSDESMDLVNKKSRMEI